MSEYTVREDYDLENVGGTYWTLIHGEREVGRCSLHLEKHIADELAETLNYETAALRAELEAAKAKVAELESELSKCKPYVMAVMGTEAQNNILQEQVEELEDDYLRESTLSALRLREIKSLQAENAQLKASLRNIAMNTERFNTENPQGNDWYLSVVYRIASANLDHASENDEN